MITITVKKRNGNYLEFVSKGHAGYAEEGQDIVCAAVSVLVINTVNSLETFTDDQFEVQEEDVYKRQQLMQNRYYLSVLGRSIQSYTYISSQNRLVRLTNHDHIAEADWTEPVSYTHLDVYKRQVH